MKQVRYSYVDGSCGDEERIRKIAAIIAAGLERLLRRSISSLDQPAEDLDLSGELAVTTHHGRRPDREER